MCRLRRVAEGAAVSDMSPTIKLSSPATHEFWEIRILYEDQDLLAIDKPAALLTSPDRYDPDRPNLVKLLHGAINQRKPWAAERKLAYLMNAHRLDFETSGVLLLVKSKPVLTKLANIFGSEKPLKNYIALVQGSPTEEHFQVDAKLAPHPMKPEMIRVDPKRGKRSHTNFSTLERFNGWTLLQCQPVTARTDQIRVHLKHIGLPITGDRLYGGKPLLLSSLKRPYRLKPGKIEKPLMPRLALHAEKLELPHPVTGQNIVITAPLPKDMQVSLKYLRRYAAGI
jgi:23S rRNA pseudouridine1911/1915/1917 synthase